ncbi:hypothetical protein ACJX0J_032988, partial [Zea mays]
VPCFSFSFGYGNISTIFLCCLVSWAVYTLIQFDILICTSRWSNIPFKKGTCFRMAGFVLCHLYFSNYYIDEIKSNKKIILPLFFIYRVLSIVLTYAAVITGIY